MSRIVHAVYEGSVLSYAFYSAVLPSGWHG